MSKRDEYLAGARAGIPVLLGFIPVGIAYAIMARQAGFDIFETCFMSVAVFAGASQMMAVGMYAQGAGVVASSLIAPPLSRNALALLKRGGSTPETPQASAVSPHTKVSR